MYSRLAKTCGLTLAAGLMTATLAGCVSIESSNEESSPSTSSTGIPSESPTAIEGTVTPKAKNPEGEATGTGTVPKQTAGNSFAQTVRIIESKATEKECSGNLTIDGNGEILKLIGDCQRVQITGTGNMIIGENVNDLSISGAGNIIAVNTIDDVSVSGIGNSVAWQNDDVTTHDTGQANLLGSDALTGVDLGF